MEKLSAGGRYTNYNLFDHSPQQKAEARRKLKAEENLKRKLAKATYKKKLLTKTTTTDRLNKLISFRKINIDKLCKILNINLYKANRLINGQDEITARKIDFISHKVRNANAH